MYYLCCSIAVCVIVAIVYFMKMNAVIYKQLKFMMIVLCMLLTDSSLLGIAVYRSLTGNETPVFFHYLYLLMLMATIHLYTVTMASYNGMMYINKNVRLPLFYYAVFAIGLLLLVLNTQFNFLFEYTGSVTASSTPAGLVLTAALYFNCVAAVLYVYKKRDVIKKSLIYLSPLALIISMIFKLIHFSHPDWLFSASADTLLMLFMYMTADGLTDIYHKDIGVYSSHAFWQFAEKCESDKYPVRIVMIHIENIRLLNARLGSYVVDSRIFREVAKFLRQASESSVFYMDNNVFTVLIDENSKLTPDELASKIDVRFQHSWRVNSNTGIVLSMMQCVVNFPQDIKSLTQLSDLAEVLRNKKSTEYADHHNVLYACDIILDSRLHAAKIENSIKQAIKDTDRISILFNPVLSSLDDKLSSAEITTCINDPELGMLTESEFTPVAETCGLIMTLNITIFEKICSMFDDYRNVQPIPFSFISINISSMLYMHDNLLNVMYGILSQHDLPTNFINLQMTEGTIDFAPQMLRMNVKLMHKAGFRFTLNHYGSGYFSVKQLLDLPFESVQLDRNFLHTIESGSDKAKIAIKGTILTLQQMNLSVIADGVSSREQVKDLNNLGCDHIKGDVISRPLEFYDLMNFVQYYNVKNSAF